MCFMEALQSQTVAFAKASALSSPVSDNFSSLKNCHLPASAGETQAEYFMEGLLNRLTSHDNPVSQSLLQQAVFYLVPNMCPGG